MTTPSTPRLYHTALSPYCRKVRLVLGEKRVEVELVEERWWEPGSEILRRNPAGKIPVLRLALAEPDFFASIEHPARQLIDRMGAAPEPARPVRGSADDAPDLADVDRIKDIPRPTAASPEPR